MVVIVVVKNNKSCCSAQLIRCTHVSMEGDLQLPNQLDLHSIAGKKRINLSLFSFIK